MPVVHGSPSSHAVPAISYSTEHAPDVVSHREISQASAGGHGEPAPVHAPPWQRSVAVHGLPSLHPVPSGSGTLSHRSLPSLHESDVQGLPSSQLRIGPGSHRPKPPVITHTSPSVQKSPSLQVERSVQPVDPPLQKRHGFEAALSPSTQQRPSMRQWVGRTAYRQRPAAQRALDTHASSVAEAQSLSKRHETHAPSTQSPVSHTPPQPPQ